MPRNRTIYQSEALYVSATATGAHFESGLLFTTPNESGHNLITGLWRVQNANYAVNLERRPVQQYGDLVALDYVILSSPTVTLDFTYLANSVFNERILGLTISSGNYVSALSGILAGTTDSKNYFIKTVKEGDDVDGNTAQDSNIFVAGIGNGFLNSYRAEGSVGNFPTVRATVEGLNFKVDDTPTGKPIPAVNPSDGSPITGIWYSIPGYTTNPSESALNAGSNVVTYGGPAPKDFGLNISALRPGDITVDFGMPGTTANSYSGVEVGAKVDDIKIQSYSVDFNLNRVALEKLGSRFAFARLPQFPVPVNISLTANVGDLRSGNLIDEVGAARKYDFAINIHRPNTPVSGRTVNTVVAQYVVKGSQFISQQFNSAIGNNKSVTLNFLCQIGGPQNSGTGFFISGLN